MLDSLRITEIFYSLQGESNTVGLPTVFIRLTGCPLRCGYCDTAYAFSGGQKQTIDEILAQVKQYNPRYVTVSGGEPLAQANVHQLLTRLCDQEYQVSIETSGALDISQIDARVIIVMDIKTPASGEVSKNYLANLLHLRRQDQVKFVICDRRDYQWSKQQLINYQLAQRCQVLFSPSYEQQSASQLADWIVADNLPVRFQIQLHKCLWGDKKGV